MQLRSPLTRDQRATLKNLGVSTDRLTALTDNGCDIDTALTLLTARINAGGGAMYLKDDVDLLRLLHDPQLLLRIIKSRCDVDDLDFALRNNHLTVEHVREALDLGLDPVAVAVWVHARRPVSALTGPLAALPGLDPRTVVQALLVGLTVDDLAWMDALGVTIPERGLRDVVTDILYDSTLTDDPAGTIDNQLAQMTGDQRRLCLVLIARLRYNGSAVLALTTSLGDVPWIDTLTTLILDGTPVHTAITLARADHGIETARAVTVGRATPTAAVDTAVHAR